MSNFLCSGCGACCLRVGGTYGLPGELNGPCGNLNKQTMACNIYETRPNICRVDEAYSKIKKYIPFLGKKTWNKLNTKVCHVLIDINKLDKKHKIKISEYDERTETK